VMGDIFEAGTLNPADAANLLLTVDAAGVGGAAEVQPGDGGRGNKMFVAGANGGSMHATGGEGGSNLVLDDRVAPFKSPGAPGDGGLVDLLDGNGGHGYDSCLEFPYGPGGRGGRGGFAFGATGGPGVDANAKPAKRGDVFLVHTGNGDNGGHGVAPGDGGDAGGLLLSLFGTVHDDGKSYTKGKKGVSCALNFTQMIIDIAFDPSVHKAFVQLDIISFLEWYFGEPVTFNRQVAPGAQALAAGSAATPLFNITIEGPAPWQTMTGLVFSDDSVKASAIATYAGRPNVQALLAGVIVKNAAGALIGFDAKVTVGARGELPGGNPIIYNYHARTGPAAALRGSAASRVDPPAPARPPGTD
jgi:hypothetical protein